MKEKLLTDIVDNIWNQLYSKLDGKFSYGPLIPQSLAVEVVESEWKFRLAKNLSAESEFIDVSYIIFPELFSLTKRSHATLSISCKAIEKFNFLVRTEDFKDLIKKKLFSLKEVEIGQPKFDSRFFFSTNDEKNLKALFSDPQIQNGMLDEKNFILGFNDGQLLYKTEYPIHNINHLKKIFGWLGRVMICVLMLNIE